MSEIDAEQIKGILFGDEDLLIRHQFIESYSLEIEKFCELMSTAFKYWSALDRATKDKEKKKAYISALLYTALHSHVVALKLFISGLMVPAGNTQRYVLECIALAFLFSRPSLGVIDKYMNDKYSTNKAIRDLVRNHQKLGLNREALTVLEDLNKFYDKFSHPTRISLGAIMTFDGPDPKVILGGAYDPGKDFVYRKELKSKVGLAEILPNIIIGVQINLRDED